MNTNSNLRFERIQRGITYFILITLAIALVFELIRARWELFFITALTILLCLLPYTFQKKYRIYLPSEVQLAIVAFIYAGSFLGEVQNFYVRFWWWDSLLHLFSGVVIGLIVFGVMYVLYNSKKIHTSLIFISLIIFCVSMTAEVMWEVYEFGMDQYFGKNMQRAKDLCQTAGPCDSRLGLMDTMKDLLLGTIGSVFVSVLGYIYLKKGDQFLLNGLVKKFTNKNPHLFYK